MKKYFFDGNATLTPPDVLAVAVLAVAVLAVAVAVLAVAVADVPVPVCVDQSLPVALA